MHGEDDPRRGPAPFRTMTGAADPRFEGRASRSALRRFLGGSPIGVFVKLTFLSVVVGASMATLGLTPGQLIRHAYDAARALIDLGLETFEGIGGWIVAGAVVVVPLWLVSRFLAMGR